MLAPVIPDTAGKIKQTFNYDAPGLGWQDPGEVFSINKVDQLFPRVDIKDFFADEEPKKPTKKEKEEMPPEKLTEGLITFDDFNKVEMVVAKVTDAEKVEKADKLLKLTVDTGTDTRTLD